jgi:ABC-2 type transport system ATP-binding protein
MEEAEYCDALALIYRGRMIAHGTPHAVKTEAMPEDVLELRVDRPFDALAAIEGSGLVREAALFGDALHAVVADAAAATDPLRARLVEAGFAVESLQQVTPSLEDAFVSLIEAEDRAEAGRRAPAQDER